MKNIFFILRQIFEKLTSDEKIGQKRPKQPKTAKIYVLRAKKWFYVIGTFFGTFWQNLKKILGTVFSQSLKNPEMTSNLPLTSIFLAKNGQNSIFTGEKMVLCNRYNFVEHFINLQVGHRVVTLRGKYIFC